MLEGKTAIVTGATGGIGGAIVRDFLKNKARILISGTSEEKLNKLKLELNNEFEQSEIFVKKCDISSSSEISELMNYGAEVFSGKVDILIANAGITKDGLILRMSEDDWDSVLDINLKSAFLLSKIAVKSMMKQRSGRIILLSSVVAITGNAGQVNYCASKAGLIGFAKALAQEVASRNITVNAIAPGFIKSQMTDALTETQVSSIISKIPLGRYGTPQEIAYTASFLASDLASYITGQTININGGMYM